MSIVVYSAVCVPPHLHCETIFIPEKSISMPTITYHVDERRRTQWIEASGAIIEGEPQIHKGSTTTTRNRQIISVVGGKALLQRQHIPIF